MPNERRPAATQLPPGWELPPQYEPLARRDPAPAAAASAPRATQRPAGGRRTGVRPTPHSAPAAATPAPTEGDGPPEVDFGTFIASLPLAIAAGYIIKDLSLDALPFALAGGAGLMVYQTVRQPAWRAQAVAWLADATGLDAKAAAAPARAPAGGDLFARVQARMARAAPAPVAQPARGTGGASVRATVAARAASAPSSAAARRMAAIDGAAEATAGDAPIPGLGTVTLEQIANLDNLWVVGPKGSGKTTVLKRLLQLRRGEHLALDPHATPGKWPGAQTIGGGRDFMAIRRSLAGQVAIMDRRYKAMAAGEATEAQCKAARRTVVGDEWLAIAAALPARAAGRGQEGEPGAADRLLEILTEGRKAGVCILAASHADTATAMGMLGKRDVLKCFDMVIYLGAMAVERVPGAAAMARPAVVFDPERGAFAQLRITIPDAAAPAQSTPTATPRRPRMPPVAAVGGEAHVPPAARVVAAAPARPAMVSERVAAPAPVAAPVAVPAPLPANVTRLDDWRAKRATPDAAPAPGGDELLAHLLASSPAPAASPAPASVAKAAPTPTASAPPAEPPANAQSVAVEHPGGGQVIINVQQTAGRAGGTGGRRRAGKQASPRRLTLTDDDRAKLPAARQLARSVGKTEAIKRVYEHPSGRRYSLIARAFDDPAA
jgi:hypothetical protein